MQRHGFDFTNFISSGVLNKHFSNQKNPSAQHDHNKIDKSGINKLRRLGFLAVLDENLNMF